MMSTRRKVVTLHPDDQDSYSYPPEDVGDGLLTVAPITGSTGNKSLDSLHASLRHVDSYNALSDTRRGRHKRASNEASEDIDVSGVALKYPDDEGALQSYHAEIVKGQSDVAFLKRELFKRAKTNESQKLVHLCNILRQSGHSLTDDRWLGDIYREPVIAVAVTNNCTEAVKVLIEFGGPDLVCKSYSTPKQGTIVSLHLAIIRENVEIIRCLLGALSDDVKTALLSCPKGRNRGAKVHKPLCTPPLALAVRVGNFDVIEVLLTHDAHLLGADPTSGNTLLHCLAEIGVKSPRKAIDIMYRIAHGEAAKLWWARNRDPKLHKDKSLAEVMLRSKNAAGYTPLTYAMLIHSTEYAASVLNMINVYTLPNWDVNPEYDRWFEVSEIDPVVRNGNTFSVLEMYTYSMSDRILTLGELPQINKVIENKWKRYKSRFIAWFVLHVCVMIAFTVYTNVGRIHPLLRTNRQNNANLSNQTTMPTDATVSDHVCLLLEIFVLLVSVIYLVAELVDLVHVVIRHFHCTAESLKYHLLVVLHHFDLNSLMMFLFSASVPVMFVLRIVDSSSLPLFQTLAAINGWSFVMFYIRALKDVGIFTAMVYRMIIRELTNITVLIMIAVIAYGTGFDALWSNDDDVQRPNEVRSLYEIYFRLIKVTVGLEEFDVLDEAIMPWLAKVIFIGFLLLSQILLLNVLIAAMNNTYNQLASMKQVIGIHVLSGTILLIERWLPKCLWPSHGLVQLDELDEGYWYLGCDITEEDKPWKSL
ncbi:hypothetical protein LSH36_502g01055 [Paralvinella palmiformis]|uniref:Ion transport domain-containing protein n=1 Tax=Paralvinella palmiformis TaxID=53620 RepID=A0AAD9J9B3_9ANNE|nr:hypothetical protein LSH36_502g01055 [Paralvinella palmiformis]